MTSRPNSGSDPWQRANELFHQAMELPPERREAFLREGCGTNTTLFAQVWAMVEASTRASGFLERPTGMVSGHQPPASYAAVGQLVGQYRIDRILGEGGMGVVYLAEDTRLGRAVAVKAVSPSYTHDASRRERLRREARAAAALSHPGIATVYALEEYNGDFFIIGEYVLGETLREEISRGPIAVERVLDTAVSIADALAAAHDRGIVHRDLKPENLMRTASGQIKILDFGLARLRDASSADISLTATGSILGTPAYMSPEQIRHDAVDGRADLFALGVVLHEMATGIHPFAARNPASTIARILESEAPSLDTSASAGGSRAGTEQMRSALDAIIRTCLRKQPADRFASAHDLQAALERARNRLSVIVPGGQPTSRLRWWKFHQLATCVAYAALMVPMWAARQGIGGKPGLFLWLATLGAVVASSVLRLHLWFTAASMPTEWEQQHRQIRPWLRLADVAVVLGFMVAGMLIVENVGAAAVLISAGVICGLSFAIIEPATTRAAFRQPS